VPGKAGRPVHKGSITVSGVPDACQIPGCPRVARPSYTSSCKRSRFTGAKPPNPTPGSKDGGENQTQRMSLGSRWPYGAGRRRKKLGRCRRALSLASIKLLQFKKSFRFKPSQRRSALTASVERAIAIRSESPIGFAGILGESATAAFGLEVSLLP